MTEAEHPRPRLFQVLEDLPEDFAGLRAEALGEGYTHIERLAEDWASGAMRFENPNEMLLAAASGDILAGIGGLTIEPALPATLRLRRFYVRPAFRRARIGRAIADRLIDHAKALQQDLTLNALTPEACAFWERLGFVPDQRLGFSHRMSFQAPPGS